MTQELLDTLRDMLRLLVYLFALGAVIAVAMTIVISIAATVVDPVPCQKSARPVARLA